MSFSFERPTWTEGMSLNTPKRRLIAAATTGAVVLALGIPVANAVEASPELALSSVDGLVVVQGSDFTEGSTIKLTATVAGGAGAGSVTAKADGTLAAAFELPDGFTGKVTVKASGDESASDSITIGASSSSSDSSSSDSSNGSSSKLGESKATDKDPKASETSSSDSSSDSSKSDDSKSDDNKSDDSKSEGSKSEGSKSDDSKSDDSKSDDSKSEGKSMDSKKDDSSKSESSESKGE